MMRNKTRQDGDIRHGKGATGLALVVAAALALPGCGGFRKTFGMTKQSPDEMSVIREQPLAVPPDFALRPPKPGEPRPQDVDSQGQALDALFGPGTRAPARSPGEQAMLGKAQGRYAGVDIRATLRDDGTRVVDKGAFLKTLLSAQDGATEVATANVEFR